MTKTKYHQIGSSETICETTFDFSDYQKVVPEHKNKLNKEFLTYFIGFFEGDGSLLINYKRGSVEFVLDQHSNELAFCVYPLDTYFSSLCFYQLTLFIFLHFCPTVF